MASSNSASQRVTPKGRPVQYQSWRDLLFLHWRFDPKVIQSQLPPGLEVELFDDDAWIGLVPFSMERIRPRFFPPVPGISWFLEFNVRTYVRNSQGVTGVWFFTLECNQWLAVQIARRFFHLPYQWCRMSRTRVDRTVTFRSSRRTGPDSRTTEVVFERPGDSDVARTATEGTLEYFLLERYELHAPDPNAQLPRIGSVRHRPYPFHSVRLLSWNQTLFELVGLPAPEHEPDHVAWSPGVDVTIYPLERHSR